MHTGCIRNRPQFQITVEGSGRDGLPFHKAFGFHPHRYLGLKLGVVHPVSELTTKAFQQLLNGFNVCDEPLCPFAICELASFEPVSETF